jgi:hypothetical protein
MKLSRREFLKTTGLAAGGLFLPPLPPQEAPREMLALGRAVSGLYIYERPTFNSRQLNFLGGDTVFQITGEAVDEGQARNKRWWRVRRGFVHSAPVQLVSWNLQTPAREVPKEGFVAEVTVPMTQSRVAPGPGFKRDYKYYFGTTHWVRKVEVDDEGRLWYGILGDRTKTYSWVRGEHLHRVTAEDLTPISPDVTDKRIEISLGDQTMHCYEGDALVLETKCSTGIPLRVENGKTVFGTPIGDWQVISKRPSRHMAGDDGAAADFFDLPGVPWVSYFHWWGTAIHGTYWHNDFGRPRSHGCINVPNDVAKWVYRWTTPSVPLDKPFVDEKGTRVIVAE